MKWWEITHTLNGEYFAGWNFSCDVDKVGGIIECKLTAMASTATAIVPIEVSCVDQNGYLSATSLCKSVQNICN